MDHLFNRLLAELDMKYHTFKSNGPNITNDQDLLRLIVSAEKGGGMTPRIATEIVADIMGWPSVEKWPEGIEPDVPFSLQMAERVKNQAQPNEPGQQVTAIKGLKQHEPVDVLEALMVLRNRMISEATDRD
jgi:hypothetical protein